MEKFITLTDNENKQFSLRLKILLGTFTNEEGEHQYFDAFNHDVNGLNQLLEHPKGMMGAYAATYALQEQYNLALEEAKVRWAKGDKDFTICSSITRDLASKKKLFKTGLQAFRAQEKKYQELEKFLEDQEQENSPWTRLHEKVMVLDEQKPQNPSRVALLKTIRTQWESMDVLAKCNAKDLLHLQDELDNFQEFVSYILSALPRQIQNNTDKIIQAHLQSNQEILNRYRQRLLAAMTWKLQSASISKNLRCDDSMLALTKLIQSKVFEHEDETALVDVADLIEIPQETTSYEMDFDDFNKIQSAIRQNNHQEGIHTWLQSPWITNQDRNTIKLTVVNESIIPSVLVSLVPDRMAYSLGGFLRYCFFRTQENMSRFGARLRNRLVGEEASSCITINETCRQVSNFELQVQVERSMNNGFNLNNINRSSAFIEALQFPQIIERERARLRAIKPSWVTGVLFKWIPLFNRSQTYQFCCAWEAELAQAEQIIKTKCASITKYLLEDFEILLMEGISHQSFLLPENLMANIKEFVRLYGLKADVDKFNEISNPITILSKFKFLHEETENSSALSLNDDAIDSFLRFAQKYWSKSQYEAAQVLVNVITRVSLPLNKSEDKILFDKLRCLLKGNVTNKIKAYKNLMNKIAMEYIFPTGDAGNDRAYEFLKRVAPKAAKNWEAKRQNDIEDKFMILNAILSAPVLSEINLSGDEVYEASEAQLKYKNYTSYITDIKNYDKANKAKHIPLLISQATKYVQAYQGDNIHYADLLMNLCADGDSECLQTYIKKRFATLFDARHQGEFTIIGVEEFQLYYYIANHPALASTVVNIINEQYDGDDTSCAEIILTINHPEITACYFAKHVEKLIHDGHAHQLVDDNHKYDDFLENPLFVTKVNEVITSYCQTLIEREEWDQFESSDFCSMIEIYGNAQNKETYRLERIRRLLTINNADSTKQYLSLVSTFLGNDIENDLFPSRESKTKLLNLFSEHVSALQQGQWEGHTQYFLEHFMGDKDVGLLQNMRVRWLEDFFSHPEKFTEDNVLASSRLDAKFHARNKKMPSGDMVLKIFYGNGNIQIIKTIIMHQLDNFNESMDDEHIRIIQNYLKDNSFALDDAYPVYSRKFDVCLRGRKIMHCLNEGSLVDAIPMLRTFADEIYTLSILNQASQEPVREQMIAFNRTLLDKMLNKLTSKFADMIVDKHYLTHIDDPLSELHLNDLALERGHILRLMIESNLPVTFKEKCQILQDKSEDIIQKVTQFVSNLDFNKLHLIAFDEADIGIYTDLLSDETKSTILEKVHIIQNYLAPEDPLKAALEAFFRLVINQYPGERIKARDLTQIREFTTTQQNYPAMAQSLAQELIGALDRHETLTQFPCFNSQHSSFQRAFVTHLSPEMHERLMRSLLNKIDWFVRLKEPPDQLSRQDWLTHAMLYEWLQNQSSEDTQKMKLRVNQFLQSALVSAQNSLQTLIEKFDAILVNQDDVFSPILKAKRYLPSPNALADEQNLIKMALMVRCFGEPDQKQVLNDLLEQVAKRQRRGMMKGLSGPFFGHSLEYADKLLNLAGSQAQRQECARLIETWNRFHTVGLHEVRELAIEDTIPKYIREFDGLIYQYFIEKHNLTPEFSNLMKAKFDEWQINEDFMEPAQLLREHSIDVFHQILLAEYRKRPHGFFHRKPSESDAHKLYVAFCLSLRAHQLANIWHERKQYDESVLSHFRPADISEPLITLVGQLRKDHDIGTGDFNRSISSAIMKDKDYFASWSVEASNGAGGENRTHTMLPSPDFESGASASSATPAELRDYTKIATQVNGPNS